MSELEKIQSYIKKTGCQKKVTDGYCILVGELSALMDLAAVDANGMIRAISLAFAMGKPKAIGRQRRRQGGHERPPNLQQPRIRGYPGSGGGRRALVCGQEYGRGAGIQQSEGRTGTAC